MQTRTKRVLAILNIVSWVLFVGLCIKTGAILYSFFVSLAINSEASRNLYLGLNLSDLHRFSVGHYSTVVCLIILLSGLKAYIMYLVVKIFLKINFVHPFSTDVASLISRISYVALGVGILTLAGNGYCDWLTKRGVAFPDLQSYLGAGGEFLLLGGIIFMIAQVFKRGIEIQSENELTV